MDIIIQLLAFIGLLTVGVTINIIFVCVSDAIKTKRLEKERKKDLMVKRAGKDITMQAMIKLIKKIYVNL